MDGAVRRCPSVAERLIAKCLAKLAQRGHSMSSSVKWNPQIGQVAFMVTTSR